MIAGNMRAQKFAAAAFMLFTGVMTAAPAGDRVSATGGDIEITPFFHSSVQIEHAGKVIQVDPWSLGDLSRAKPADRTKTSPMTQARGWAASVRITIRSPIR